jgi:hypothetical protein
MKIYYKVHKNNLKFVNNITQEQVKIWSIICDENKNIGYIYIAFKDNEPWGYMPNNDYSITYFKLKSYLYMGEVANPRKLKLEKLKTIS